MIRHIRIPEAYKIGRKKKFFTAQVLLFLIYFYLPKWPHNNVLKATSNFSTKKKKMYKTRLALSIMRQYPDSNTESWYSTSKISICFNKGKERKFFNY